MEGLEGVVKFNQAAVDGPTIRASELKELQLWRQAFWRNNLIGQDPLKYGGAGMGGHEDGIISFGKTATITGTFTLAYLAMGRLLNRGESVYLQAHHKR